MINSMSPDDWAAMRKKNNDLGYHNHTFLPAGVDGPINCLWECKEETSPEAFQAFIDGPDGPASGTLVNKCWKVMDGAILPRPWNFDSPPDMAPPVEKTGSMFWIKHDFQARQRLGCTPAP